MATIEEQRALLLQQHLAEIDETRGKEPVSALPLMLSKEFRLLISNGGRLLIHEMPNGETFVAVVVYKPEVGNDNH